MKKLTLITVLAAAFFAATNFPPVGGLRVAAQPVANFTFNYTNGSCTPDSVVFTNLSTGSNAWSWNFGDFSPPSSAQNPFHIYMWGSTFTVTLTAYDTISGDSNKVMKPVTINMTPGPGYAWFWTTPANPVCPGVPVQFNGPMFPMPPATGSYWNFGDGDSLTTMNLNPVHTYTDTGIFSVTFILYAQCGSDTQTQFVVVDSGARPSANFSAWPNPICPNQDFDIWNSSMGATGYLWTFGDGDSSTAFDPNHIYSVTGSYNINLFAFNNCGSDTFSLVQNVVDTITPVVSAWVSDDSVCTNSPINFSGWSSNAVSYLWNFGDGNNSLQQNAVHAYSALGTYTATFTATNACGKSKSFNITIKVLNNLPPETVNFWTSPWSSCPSTSNICPGTTVNFTNSSSDLGTSFWNFGDATTSTLNNPTHVFAAAGSYNVKLVVTSSCGGKDSITKCVLVKTDVQPSAFFCVNTCGPPAPVCAGSIVKFINNSSDTTFVSWDFGDSSTSTLVNPTHVYADTGSYIVALTVTNPCGNSATSYQSVSVTTTGAPPNLMGVWANPTSVCPGQPVNMSGWAFTATTYKWLFGDGDSVVSSMGNTTHAYFTPGNYSPTVIAYNGCGSDTGMIQIFVKPGPSPDFNFNIPCTGDTVYFTDATTPVPNSWAWDFGDGDTSGSQNPSHLYAADGTYNVMLQASDSGCNSQVIKQVIVGINLNTAKTDASCGLPNGAATANVASGHASYSYLWNTAQTTSAITGITAGTYKVTVTDAASCIDSATVVVNNVGGVPSTAPASASAAPDTICAGGNSTLTVSGGSLGTGANWIWHRDSCSGVGIGAGASVIVNPASATSYFVRAEGLCNTTSCVSVTVAVNSPVTANAGADASVCTGDTYTLSGAIGGGATSATWSTSGTGNFDNTALLNATYTPSALDLMMGSVTLTLTTNNPPGPCPAATDAMLLTFSMPATASAGANAVICQGSAYTLSGSRGGSATSSTWTTSGDGTFNNPALTNATYTPGAADISSGTASLAITTDDPAGPCPAATDTMVLSINLAATVNAGPDASVCGGVPYTLSGAIGGGATSASWSTSGTGNFDNSALLNATYTPSNPDKAMGSVTLTLTTNNPPGPCPAVSDAMVLSIFPLAPAVTTSASNALCNGSCDGDATATALSGVPPYTYLWDAGAGSQTTSVATGLCAGIYLISVKDVNNCLDTASAVITEPTVLSIVTGAQYASCGSPDGYTYVTASGGTAPYSYQWDDPSSQTTDTAFGLNIGTYSVTVADINGCSETDSASVTNLGAPAVAVDTVIDALCNGDSSGSASVAVSGGTPPYTYLWDDVQVQTTSNATGLPAGTFSVSVTDAGSCLTTASASVAEPTAISLSTSATDEYCNLSDGTASVTASGGTPPYAYQWDASAGNQSTSAATGLGAGSYSVTVTDDNGCIKSASATVPVSATPFVSASISGQTNVSCNGLCDGNAVASATNGIAPYTYVWNTSPAQSTIIATGLCAANYICAVTDVAGCIDSVAVTITEPASILLTTNSTDVSCDASCDGDATVNASGGTSPYTYAWNDPATQSASTATGLCAGAFDVTVTDAKGCSDISSTIVGSPLPISLTVATADATCGNADGMASVTAGGGTSPYNYLWDDTAAQTTDTAFSLVAGIYNVTITDANGCVKTGSATVNNSGAPVLSVSSLMNIACNGDSSGAITVSVSGGTAPYSYLWDDSQSQTTSDATGLPAGTFSVTLTDAGNCIVFLSASVTEPTALSLSLPATDEYCNLLNGAAYASVSGGTTPYSYLWDSGTGSQTTSGATGLGAGSYSVTVTDDNGCQKIASAAVSLSGIPPVSASLSVQTNVSCNGGCNGGAAVSVTDGIVPFTYAWNTTPVQNTSVATGLCAATFICAVSDSAGCIDSVAVTINEPTVISLTANSTGASCDASCDGEASVIASGGIFPYTYEWNDISSQTASTATGLCPGTFDVTVTDANGCSALSNATVGSPLPITLALASADATCGNADGMASVSAGGGTSPYNYLWDDISAQTTDTAFSLAAGIYSVTVTDANGCVKSGTAIINNSGAPALSVGSTTDVACNGDSTGALTVSASGGTTPLTYQWDDPLAQTTSSATGLAAGNYALTVTDAAGCESFITATITEPVKLLAAVTSKSDNACNGDSNGTIDITATGGVSAYTFIWSNGAVTEDVAGLTAGTYSFTVTDANGCTVSESSTITEPSVLTINADSVKNTSCSVCDGEISVSSAGGTTPYIYQWSNGATGSIAGSLCAGNFSTTVTDANGCQNNISEVVTGPAGLTSSISSSADATCFSACDGNAAVLVVGGTTPYTYNWSNGETSGSAGSLCAGSFSVTATDASGCNTVSGVTVTEPSEILTAVDSVNATCGICADGGANLTVSGGTPPYTYLWSTGDVTEDIDSVLPATYFVTITDANGCIATDSIVVDFTVKTSLMPDNGNKLEIYPNPNNGKFEIRYWKPEIGKIEIYNVFGEKVYAKEIFHSNTLILYVDASGWDEGVYLIRLTGERVETIDKFVISN